MSCLLALRLAKICFFVDNTRLILKEHIALLCGDICFVPKSFLVTLMEGCVPAGAAREGRCISLTMRCSAGDSSHVCKVLLGWSVYKVPDPLRVCEPTHRRQLRLSLPAAAHI